MQKIIEFNINKKIYELVCRRIKLKSHLIELLIEISSLIIVNVQVKNEEFGKLIISVDDMKRTFFTIKEPSVEVYKHFSFNFPFKISHEYGIFKLETMNGGIKIESPHVAILRALCANGAFDERECRYGLLLDFSQLVETISIDLGLEMQYYESDLNQILMELFTFEPSYIRFDYDKERENGRIHPLNHLDVFYTQSTTFKLGCKQLEFDKFMDILDTKTECEYIGADSLDVIQNSRNSI